MQAQIVEGAKLWCGPAADAINDSILRVAATALIWSNVAVIGAVSSDKSATPC